MKKTNRKVGKHGEGNRELKEWKGKHSLVPRVLAILKMTDSEKTLGDAAK